MTTFRRPPELAALLAAHGLATAAEEPITNAGFSGAHITRLRRDDGAAFVLKRMSIDRDWIMRATHDSDCREAAFARASPALPNDVRTPSIATASDADEHALLMHDISGDLLSPGAAERTDDVLRAVASLHAAAPPPLAAIPWCDLGRRLTLLTPATARIASAYGAPVARDVTEGWRLFDRHADARTIELVQSLFDDVTPLLRALQDLPNALLHGDLKFDNIGLRNDGIWLFDWAMTLVAPAAVDLGWFLAINSRRMSMNLDEAMSRYAGYARIAGQDRARHDALTVISGLVLRGWRKALDAEAGEPAELRWWCERSVAAARFL